MRNDNLLAVRRRKFVVTSDSDRPFRVYPNSAEHLVLSDVNQLWVADLTYLRLKGEFVYLAVVLDAWSRVVGWALGRSLESALPLLALERAIVSRQPQPGLVHHSDRGSQYACKLHVGRLEDVGAVLSMSRPGCFGVPHRVHARCGAWRPARTARHGPDRPRHSRRCGLRQRAAGKHRIPPGSIAPPAGRSLENACGPRRFRSALRCASCGSVVWIVTNSP